MSTVHDSMRSADPAVRAAVDSILADDSAGPPVRAMVDRLAQALRAEHPADWMPRLRELWSLLLGAGEVWSPQDRAHGLECLRRALVDASIASHGKPGQAPVGSEGPTAGVYPRGSAEALAAAQGVRPIDDPASLAFPDWPEDETADDFIAAMREWRREGPAR